MGSFNIRGLACKVYKEVAKMADWELKGKVALLILHMQEDIVGRGVKVKTLDSQKFAKMPVSFPEFKLCSRHFVRRNYL